MAVTSGLLPSQFTVSIRFVQGYRFLDRCGEALIALEDALGDGWIPTEASPRSGSLKNDSALAAVVFNSEWMSVQQEAGTPFEYLYDAACRTYDTVRRLFEIRRVITPALRVVYQKGFEEGQMAEAQRWLSGLRLCVPADALLRIMGGQLDALDWTAVTTERIDWGEQSVERRRRIAVACVRQDRQAPFDERLFKRAKLLPDKQQEAMRALANLRRMTPGIPPVAAQIDAEQSLDGEYDSGFDFPGFLKESWEWCKHQAGEVSRQSGGG